MKLKTRSIGSIVTTSMRQGKCGEGFPSSVDVSQMLQTDTLRLDRVSMNGVLSWQWQSTLTSVKNICYFSGLVSLTKKTLTRAPWMRARLYGHNWRNVLVKAAIHQEFKQTSCPIFKSSSLAPPTVISTARP
jgi:hypothetical protein